MVKTAGNSDSLVTQIIGKPTLSIGTRQSRWALACH